MNPMLIYGPFLGFSEGGFFKAHLYFPREYPLRPPKMKFITEIWHPNSKNQQSFGNRDDLNVSISKGHYLDIPWCMFEIDWSSRVCMEDTKLKKRARSEGLYQAIDTDLDGVDCLSLWIRSATPSSRDWKMITNSWNFTLGSWCRRSLKSEWNCLH